MKTDIYEFDNSEVEWENIPPIIPKYLLSIQKVFVKNKLWQEQKDKLETTQNIRDSITEQVRQI